MENKCELKEKIKAQSARSLRRSYSITVWSLLKKNCQALGSQPGRIYVSQKLGMPPIHTVLVRAQQGS